MLLIKYTGDIACNSDESNMQLTFWTLQLFILVVKVILLNALMRRLFSEQSSNTNYFPSPANATRRKVQSIKRYIGYLPKYCRRGPIAIHPPQSNTYLNDHRPTDVRWPPFNLKTQRRSNLRETTPDRQINPLTQIWFCSTFINLIYRKSYRNSCSININQRARAAIVVVASAFCGEGNTQQ